MTDNPKTQQPPEDAKSCKKAKSKKRLYLILVVLAVFLVVVIILSAMLFHRPSYYQPLDVAEKGVVSAYLTNQLLPEFYNGVQYQEPFDIVVSQNGINDVVARFNWPKKFGSISVSGPAVFFTPETLVVMGTVSVEGTELVATIIARPEIDAEGLLNLRVSSVRLGAVDITLIAKVLVGDLYQRQTSRKDSFGDKAVRSILYDEPFDPVFEIEDKKVRLRKITLEPQKLTLRFDPVFE